MNHEELRKLRNWLDSDCIDDPEELLEEVYTIIGLIDFYLEHHIEK